MFYGNTVYGGIKHVLPAMRKGDGAGENPGKRLACKGMYYVWQD